YTRPNTRGQLHAADYTRPTTRGRLHAADYTRPTTRGRLHAADRPPPCRPWRRQRRRFPPPTGPLLSGQDSALLPLGRRTPAGVRFAPWSIGPLAAGAPCRRGRRQGRGRRGGLLTLTQGVALGGQLEEAAVVARELGNAFVAHRIGCLAGG